MCIITLIVKRTLKMTVLNENGVLHKLWHFLRTYILTLARFDLFLQGALLITILLETNVFLLLRRDHGGGQTPSFIEDWIIISAGGAEFLFGTLLGWWGARKRNFALSGWLALTSVSGLLVLLFPFDKERSPHVELCGGHPVNKYSEFKESSSDITMTFRTVFLITTALACSLTRLSVWAHGFSYLDDHDPQNGPYYYGILISIRLSLGLSGQNWLQPSSLGNDWWKSHLSISCLTLMFAVLFTLFPRRMKQYPENEDEMTSTSFISSLQRVVRNKVLVLQSAALALLSAAVSGFVHYDRAYVQARFHVESYRQDPQTSRGLSDIFRSLVIIFFVMIFRVRFSVRRSDGVKGNTASRVGGVVAAIVAVFLAVMAALSCNIGEIEGVGEEYLQPACSLQCGCDSARYGFSPVCGLDTSATFFSPCHAGCSQFEDLNGFLLFQNCSCGEQRMARGACSISKCRVAFSAYQVLFTVFLAVSGAAFLMQGMVMVRAARREDKPLAIAASFSAVALVSFVAGHLLYMTVSYLTCAYYSEGRCVLHSPQLWILCSISSVLALGSGVVSVLASRANTQLVIPTTEL